MISQFSRRSLLRLAMLSGSAMLAACAVTQNGSITTVTLDTARIVTDGRAIVGALDGVLAIPAIATLLDANLVTAEAALHAADLALSEIQDLTGGAVTVSIDTARVQTLVMSLLGDVQSVLGLLQGALPSLPAALSVVATELSTAIDAVRTLIPLVQLAAGLVGSAPAAPSMTEAQALAIAARAAR